MRSKYLSLAAIAFVVACADAPMAPLLQPGVASLDLDRPPPPWALVKGGITTDGSGEILASVSFSRSADGAAVFSHNGNAATYHAWLLVTPGDQTALLRFTEGGTATFSNGAMISNVKGKVRGRGTMTVGGHTYELSAVTEFEANGDCATIPWDGPNCASFSAGDGSFSSEASVWTGILSNDGGGGNKPDNPGPPIFCETECVIVCPNCVIVDNPKGRGR